MESDGSNSQNYLSVTVTSNVNAHTTERRFPSSTTILALKGKLELLTGGDINTMKLELRNKDQECITQMADNSMTIGDYGTENGMIIHVIDVESDDKDEPEVTFELSEEEYAKREESARLFLMKNKLGKYDETKIQKKEEEEVRETALAASITVDSRCEITVTGAPPRRGIVKYVGKVNFKPGDWVGIQYDEPVGKNDGQVEGKRYFECHQKYGGFVRPSSVKIGDFSEIGLEDLDEI